MSTSSFTFINTVNAPKPSRKDVKKARGHVTKATWSNYRLRKQIMLKDDIGIKKKQVRPEKATMQAHSPPPSAATVSPFSEYKPGVTERHLALLLSEAITRLSIPSSAADLIVSVWPLLFSVSHLAEQPATPVTTAWSQLLASEPAFMEATLAAALRFWSPDVACEERARAHYARAVELGIKRISDMETQHVGMGFMAYMLTMAIEARMGARHEDWQMHAKATVMVMKAKSDKGEWGEIRTFLHDFLMLEALNDVFGFPRMFDFELIREIGLLDKQKSAEDDRMRAVLDLSQRVIGLRRRIKQEKDVDDEVIELIYRCQELHGQTDNPMTKLASKTFELILHLTITTTPTKEMQDLATGIYEPYRDLSGVFCVHMELTSTPLILGMLASAPGSQTRHWFSTRLLGGVKAMGGRGWDDPTKPMFAVLATDEALLKRFRKVWDEEASLEIPREEVTFMHSG